MDKTDDVKTICGIMLENPVRIGEARSGESLYQVVVKKEYPRATKNYVDDYIVMGKKVDRYGKYLQKGESVKITYKQEKWHHDLVNVVTEIVPELGDRDPGGRDSSHLLQRKLLPLTIYLTDEGYRKLLNNQYAEEARQNKKFIANIYQRTLDPNGYCGGSTGFIVIRPGFEDNGDVIHYLANTCEFLNIAYDKIEIVGTFREYRTFFRPYKYKFCYKFFRGVDKKIQEAVQLFDYCAEETTVELRATDQEGIDKILTGYQIVPLCPLNPKDK